jgi:hypothetical protein
MVTPGPNTELRRSLATVSFGGAIGVTGVTGVTGVEATGAALDIGCEGWGCALSLLPSGAGWFHNAIGKFLLPELIFSGVFLRRYEIASQTERKAARAMPQSIRKREKFIECGRFFACAKFVNEHRRVS